MSNKKDIISRRKVLKVAGAGLAGSVFTGTVAAKETDENAGHPDVPSDAEDVGAGLYHRVETLADDDTERTQRITSWDTSVQPVTKQTFIVSAEKTKDGLGPLQMHEETDGISIQNHLDGFKRHSWTENAFEPCKAFTSYDHRIAGYSIELDAAPDEIGKATIAAGIAYLAGASIISGGLAAVGAIALAIISVGTSDHEYFFGTQDYDNIYFDHKQTMHKTVVAGDWNPDPHHTVKVGNSAPIHPVLGR